MGTAPLMQRGFVWGRRVPGARSSICFFPCQASRRTTIPLSENKVGSVPWWLGQVSRNTCIWGGSLLARHGCCLRPKGFSSKTTTAFPSEWGIIPPSWLELFGFVLWPCHSEAAVEKQKTQTLNSVHNGGRRLGSSNTNRWARILLLIKESLLHLIVLYMFIQLDTQPLPCKQSVLPQPTSLWHLLDWM